MTDLPRRARVHGHRLLRRLRGRDGRCPRRRTGRRHRHAAGHPAGRRGRTGRAGATARTAGPPTRPTRCSARTAATTSPPARCRGPSSHSPRRPAPRRRRRRPRPRTPRRHRPRPGWPRSGSTPTGTPTSRAPTRCPRPACPPSWLLKHTSVLIGRASRSRGINPDIDLSHRQRRQPPARAAHHRRHPLVGRGPRLVQRHLRRRCPRGAAEDAGDRRPEGRDGR